MIFVTLGNTPTPFIRLARAVDNLAASASEKFTVQHGYTVYPFRNVESYQFLSWQKMFDLIRQARLVITHGGYGTICECSKIGKKIIAVPRQKGREHNHCQRELVAALEQRGHILAAYDLADLPARLSEAEQFMPRPIVAGNADRVIAEFLAASFGSTPCIS